MQNSPLKYRERLGFSGRVTVNRPLSFGPCLSQRESIRQDGERKQGGSAVSAAPKMFYWNYPQLADWHVGARLLCLLAAAAAAATRRAVAASAHEDEGADSIPDLDLLCLFFVWAERHSSPRYRGYLRHRASAGTRPRPSARTSVSSRSGSCPGYGAVSGRAGEVCPLRSGYAGFQKTLSLSIARLSGPHCGFLSSWGIMIKRVWRCRFINDEYHLGDIEARR